MENLTSAISQGNRILENMISQAEAQDLLNAVAAQRDASHNREAQLSAALAKVQRESAARIAELEGGKEMSDARIADLEAKLAEASKPAE